MAIIESIPYYKKQLQILNFQDVKNYRIIKDSTKTLLQLDLFFKINL